MIVAVIGKGLDCTEEGEWAAYKAGGAIALEGHILVTGALGGCMAGASRGARNRGGVVVGLVPRDREANEWVTVPIRTGLPEPYRNVLLAHTADAAIVCAGGHGTRQELSFIVERGIPVAQYGTSMWPDVEIISGAALDSVRGWLRRALS